MNRDLQDRFFRVEKALREKTGNRDVVDDLNAIREQMILQGAPHTIRPTSIKDQWDELIGSKGG